MSIFVANWKMQKTYKDIILWCKENNQELINLFSAEKSDKFIICPSFESIATVRELIDNQIAVGAQDCSEFQLGAHTGQVSVLSLKEIGCNYCIIGHSETRNFINNNSVIAKKALLLLNSNIVPIICIGESQEDKLNNKTFDVLIDELNSIISVIIKNNIFNKDIFIAYEPFWAIGSGIVPDIDILLRIVTFIKNYITKFFPKIGVKVLYGGSVNEKNITSFKIIKNLDGFLLGSSSLDFQLFKKIVLLNK